MIRRTTERPRLFDLAAAQAWLSVRALETAAIIDRSRARRLGALGYVGGALEHLSPQSRYGGGYGVVASVDSSQRVTLAAGYTLSAGGCCRLWDASGLAHLDSGGYEWARVGSACYLPDTTGLAAGDVIYSVEPVFHDFSVAKGLLTAAGSGFDIQAELRNRSTRSLIGGWRWANGAIVPCGPVQFDAVTPTQGASIPSVSGAVLDLASSTFVVTSGYTLRIWNVTAGTLVADVPAGSWTRSGSGISAGAAVAATVAALISGGKAIRCWAEGISEFSIGGATRDVQIGAGGKVSFVATGASVVGQALQNMAGVYRRGRISAGLASYTALSAAGKMLMLGYASGAKMTAVGLCRVGADTNQSYQVDFGAPVTGTNTIVGVQSLLALTHIQPVAVGGSYWRGGSDYSASATVTSIAIVDVDYVAAVPILIADDGAVFSSMLIA